MRFSAAQFVQVLFNRAGFQIRRIEQGVSYSDAQAELIRLAGDSVRTIVEVGAADGCDTLAFSKRFPEAAVTAFEPLPDNFTKLAAVAASQPNIRAINAAVSHHAGRTTFFKAALNDASSLFPSAATGSTFDKYMTRAAEIEVDCTTLDAWAAEAGIVHVDILKMDAQGAELSILKGAQGLTSNRDIRVIYTEVLFMPIYEGVPLYHDLAQHLQICGYRLHNLFNLVHNQKGELGWGDAIFVPVA